jgi:hypothetical protein
VRRLLARDPARRPASAAAVAVDLERLAAARGARWSYPGGPSELEVEWEPELTVEAQWVPTRALTESVNAPP